MRPYIISIFHRNLTELAVFCGTHELGDGLVTLVPDSVFPRSFWGVYRVDREKLNVLRARADVSWR